MADPPDDRLVNEPHDGVGPVPPRAARLPEPDEDAPPAPIDPSLRLPRPVRYLDAVRCPYCLALADVCMFFGLYSRLGPPLFQCRKCGRTFLSHRREWSDMGLAGKAWFLIVSALYVPVVWGAVTALTAVTFFVVRAAPSLLWLLVLHASVWAAAVPAVQAWRVVRSLRRTRSPQREPFRSSPWTPDIWWPHRFIWGVLATTVALAWAAYLMRG